MTQEHPITPSDQLISDWCVSKTHTSRKIPLHIHVAIQAARWGADQELEACCEWIYKLMDRGLEWSMDLRASRRPQPPSLKEQALAELDLLKADATTHGLGFDATAIRLALESLPD